MSVFHVSKILFLLIDVTGLHLRLHSQISRGCETLILAEETLLLAEQSSASPCSRHSTSANLRTQQELR